MVTTSYVVADSLKVDLPEASTGDPTEPSQIIITLAVDKDTNARKLVLNGNEITEPNLRLAIQKVKAEGKKDLVAIIAADKIASHGEVIHLIDLVKQEGVLKFALNIESSSQ
jgi:biopolymer transport protein ExbD